MAGATGVETAGALADMIHDVMPQRYHDLARRARPTIYLVDHGDVVLAPFSDKAHDYAAKVLDKKGVELLLGASVTEVDADRVVFADGIRDPVPLRRLGRRAEGRAPSTGTRCSRDRARRPHQRRARTSASRASPGVYAVGDVAAGDRIPTVTRTRSSDRWPSRPARPWRPASSPTSTASGPRRSTTTTRGSWR